MICNLITDFGVSSPYVGVMKATLLKECPEVKIIDTSHGIHPQSVPEAAFILSEVFDFFPKDTIHVVVVDPGVGTERDIVLVQCDEQYIICPDNGLLSYLLENRSYKAHRIAYKADEHSHTFHGRDVMIPAAAKLLNGRATSLFGDIKQKLQFFELPEVKRDGRVVRAHVVFIDSFGNCITNLESVDGEVFRKAVCGDIECQVVRTYAEAERGKPIALVGSTNKWELAMSQGSLHLMRDIKVLDQVEFYT